jgi:hypothetical protein
MTISKQPNSSDRELLFERVIHAPSDKLFRADAASPHTVTLGGDGVQEHRCSLLGEKQ